MLNMNTKMPPYIDLHCDNVLVCDEVYAEIYAENGKDAVMELRESKSQMDLLRMRKAKCMAQFFAIFPNIRIAKKLNITVQKEFERLYEIQMQQINKNSDLLRMATNAEEMLRNYSENRISAFLAIEDGGLIDSVERLDYYYSKGIRYITLVWNYNSGLGHPGENVEFRECGLTRLGAEVVEAMNCKGMLVDISHANEKTAKDVLAMAKSPVIASHSCVEAVCNHTRNIGDGVLKKLANGGGVTGIVFFEEFLQDDKQAPNTFAVIKKHIDHIVNVAGIDTVALGSDFDGYTHNEKSQVKEVTDIPLLGEYLLSNGYKEAQVEKIFNGNVYRVIKDVLR